MAKTERELAFLRDLDINENWTKRFTDLLDAHVAFKKAENILYINAGTGDHCIAIAEKTDEKTAVFATCDTDGLLKIARDKGAAVGSEVDFSRIEFEDDSFDAVVIDATFTRPDELDDAIGDAVRVARTGGRVAVFLPTAGSYGEVFSLLWEILFNEDLGEHGAAVEAMIADIPSIGRIEEIAVASGLEDINTEYVKEVFEYENGAAFVASPLVADFLLPVWLEYLDDDAGEHVTEKLAQLIDAEDADLTFRFTVRATLLTGTKI